MNHNTKMLILVGLFIALYATLSLVFIHNQKVECLENGGRWTKGFVAGGYSAFCIPK